MKKITLYRVLEIGAVVVALIACLLLKKEVFGPELSLPICIVPVILMIVVCIYARMQIDKLSKADEKTEIDIPDKAADAGQPTLLVEGFPNDRLYFVFATQTYYAFVNMGHAEFGIKEDKLPDEPLTDGDRQHAAAKDIWVAKSEILDGTLKMKRCVSTQLPSCAALKFKTRDGKKYNFIILQNLDEKTIRSFFADVEKRIS